eukprot:scaffold20875_cov85-Skeletonema_dohrnii-CCMP3373.AAC.3
MVGQFPVPVPVPVPVYTRDHPIGNNWRTSILDLWLWRAQSFVTLNLAANNLMGTITSLVGDLAVMKDSLRGLIDSLQSRQQCDHWIHPIPVRILLQGASIYLKGNLFNDGNRPAPLSLCALRAVEAFDLESDPKLCPPQRNALNDFFDEAKGGDWLNASGWQDEYASYCSWNGVTCDETDQVTKLKLSTNGLSGKLSKSISDLTSLEELDLSNNDMKCHDLILKILTLVSPDSTYLGSISADLGLLSNLSCLRLSYNVFNGTAPVGLDAKCTTVTVPSLNDSHGFSTVGPSPGDLLEVKR